MRVSNLPICRNALAALSLVLFALTACTQPGYRSSTAEVPAVKREFRGVWVASVGNISWPSDSGLPVAQQKEELIALLDKAKSLNFNVVIFQIRPSCDALYHSAIEPWSEYLSGKQGQAPSPYYDPLAFCIEQAQKRDLELHAWFNPFRARYMKATSAPAADHISQRRPDLIRSYGDLLWLDPGEPEAQDYSLRVMLDVVKRYDIDAVHIDDYFYPYPIKDSKGKDLDFPDDSSWERFGKASGLSRNDWRRRNVDQFVQNLYESVHDIKPHVKVGISPFGIWRPGHPEPIKGLDAYDKLYADARRWLHEGWFDYMAPQLYWPIDIPATSYRSLLEWWDEQNTLQRHLFPGLNAVKVINDWPVSEISRQLELNRSRESAIGEVFWSVNALLESAALSQELAENFYQEPVLPPASSWLDPKRPPAPLVEAKLLETGQVEVTYHSGRTEKPWRWLLQYQLAGEWKNKILPRDASRYLIDGEPTHVAVSALDRIGKASLPSVLENTD